MEMHEYLTSGRHQIINKKFKKNKVKILVSNSRATNCISRGRGSGELSKHGERLIKSFVFLFLSCFSSYFFAFHYPCIGPSKLEQNSVIILWF